jgi:hypothetical protein
MEEDHGEKGIKYNIIKKGRRGPEKESEAKPWKREDSEERR